MRTSVGLIVTKACVLGGLLLLVFSTACSSPTTPRMTLLRFEGVVSAENGGPLAGAKVSLRSAFFVWAGPVHDTWTDANGRYSLEHSVECVRNEDLYHGPVSAYYLVASADGHWSRSSAGLERSTLRCVTVIQRLDFVLPSKVAVQDADPTWFWSEELRTSSRSGRPLGAPGGRFVTFSRMSGPRLAKVSGFRPVLVLRPRNRTFSRKHLP